MVEIERLQTRLIKVVDKPYIVGHYQELLANLCQAGVSKAYDLKLGTSKPGMQ